MNEATKDVNDAIAGLVLRGPTVLDKAKEAVRKALKEADVIYKAGQKNYADTTWKAFTDAYRAAEKAPANATAAVLKELANKLEEARKALEDHRMNSWKIKKRTNTSVTLMRECSNKNCKGKHTEKATVKIPKTISLGQSKTIKSSNPNFKITMEIKKKDKYFKEKKDKVISKKGNYFIFDKKKGKIQTRITTKAFKKSVTFLVDTGDGAKVQKVKVKLSVPTPKERQFKIIPREDNGYKRYTFQYNIKKATRIQVRTNIRGSQAVFDRYISQPKSNSESYIRFRMPKDRELIFKITVYYGKNNSKTISIKK